MDIFDSLIRGEGVDIDYPLAVSIKSILDTRIHQKSALKNAIFCLLALEEPKHFNNGTTVILDRSLCSDYNDPQKHHIFPRAFLEKAGVSKADINALPNFAFIPAELNKFISDKKPSVYMAGFKKNNSDYDAAMRSHLIPAGSDSGIWSDNYDVFLTKRAGLLYELVKKAVA